METLPIPEFGSAQLTRQAGLNASATILSILAFLKGRDLPPSEWISFIGTTFAASWDSIRHLGPQKALELVVLDMCSIGATIVSLESDPATGQAQAVFKGWPDPALLAPFGLSVAEAFAFMDIFSFLAAPIGLGYQARLLPSISALDANGNPLSTAEVLIEVRLWNSLTAG